VVLATGRFFGGGLLAERDRVREPLLDLPVQAPASRNDWHMNTFLGAPGHPLNRAGIRVDRRLRPLGADGGVLYENLYAAGAVLADHDWVREKSGAGISVATGTAAVEAFLAAAGRSDAGARP
jgi:glycerol-3-phosphate dehydrogenase subunit B